MARSQAAAPPTSSASGAATTVATLQQAEAIRGLQRDAVVASLTKGWAKLQEMIPTQAKAISLIADGGIEAADAGVLKMSELMTTAINDKRGAMTARTRAEADRVLAELKGALVLRGGRVDPASEKAIGVIQDALSVPLEKVTNPARAAVFSMLREGLREGDALRQITDLYYKLDATTKAIATMIVAGALTASQVPNFIKVSKDSLSITVPSSVRLKIPALGTFGLTSFGISGKTLTNLSAQWSRAVGPGAVTFAVQYRRDLASSTPSVTSTAEWKGRGAGVSTSYETEGGRQAAAASVTTQTQLPRGTTLSTATGVTATATSPRSARDIALGLRSRADVMSPTIPLGRKGGGLSAGGYAEVDLPAGRAAAYQTGIRATGTFGAAARPTRAERRADRYESQMAKKEARKAHIASRRPHGNLRVVRALAGPLPAVEALVANPAIPAVEPTPAQAPAPTVSGVALAAGAAVLAAALGGWWWWTHRQAGGAAVALEDLDAIVS